MEVLIDGVKYVPEEAKDGFAVGDVVEYVGTGDAGLLEGALGKVVAIDREGAVGVEFFRWFSGGHDCQEAAVNGHGRWFYPSLAFADRAIHHLRKLP